MPTRARSPTRAASTPRRAKVAVAREDPTVVAAQEWSGMDLVLEQLMNLLRTTGVSDPGRRDAFLN
jgi:hypothetical protein